MVTLTNEAQTYLERYMRQIKAALRGHSSVDAGEVERDVLGHIDAELAGQPEPIGAGSLREVLDRLGSPDSWVPAGDLPAWRRVVNRLRSGPEDWRLAYLTLALFIAGPTLFLSGPYLWPLELLLPIASLLTARAALALLAEHDEPVGPRRWLIYPPLIAWYSLLALAVVAGPLALLAAALESPSAWHNLLTRGFTRSEIVWMVRPSIFLACVGAWWAVLGLLLLRFQGAVQLVFWPCAEWLERRHGKRLATTGALLVILSFVLAAAAWSTTGVVSAAQQTAPPRPAVPAEPIGGSM